MSRLISRRFTRRLLSNLVPAVLLLICSVHGGADEISIWNFNDSDLATDHGSGTLNSNFNPANILFAAGSTNNARLGDPAGQALSLQGGTSNANNGRNITINVSTVGFPNIIVSLATHGTSTGFNSNQFQYSLDGTTFIDFGSPYAPATGFGSLPIVFTISSVPGLNDNPNVVFRIVFTGATSSTGTNRIDNIVVEGSSETIPEPATAVLLLTGLTSLYGIKRRRPGTARWRSPI